MASASIQILSESDYKKKFKEKPSGAYFFFGAEDYTKSYAVSAAVKAVSADHTLAFFNEIKLDSFTYSPAALTDAIMAAPMMADNKIITLTGLDIRAFKPSEIDSLCECLSLLDEFDYNTVIISVSSDKFDVGKLPPKPSYALQKISEVATVVEFQRNSSARLSAWAQKHFEHNGVIANPQICSRLIDKCGTDMYNLATEIDKLSYYALSQNRAEVIPSDIDNVTIATAEYGAFAFTNALSAMQKDKALDILLDMKHRRLDPVIIMGEITKLFCSMLSVALLKSEGKTTREIASILNYKESRVSIIQQSLPSLEVCRSLVKKATEADLEIKSGGGYSAIEKYICTL